MAVDAGLVLDGYRSLAEVCAPLAEELSRCYWLIDIQSGPFKAMWWMESEENEAEVERVSWPVPGTAGTSTRGLRPGSLPRLADRLVFDEQSYYFAIDAAEDEALSRAGVLERHMGDCSESFLRELDRYGDLLIWHVDGWWEFYTGRPDWRRRLREAWPECYERPLGDAGDPPVRTARG
jgi:hypothetical protein